MGNAELLAVLAAIIRSGHNGSASQVVQIAAEILNEAKRFEAEVTEAQANG